jgi:hypothetical protein
VLSVLSLSEQTVFAVVFPRPKFLALTIHSSFHSRAAVRDDFPQRELLPLEHLSLLFAEHGQCSSLVALYVTVDSSHLNSTIVPVPDSPHLASATVLDSFQLFPTTVLTVDSSQLISTIALGHFEQVVASVRVLDSLISTIALRHFEQVVASPRLLDSLISTIALGHFPVVVVAVRVLSPAIASVQAGAAGTLQGTTLEKTPDLELDQLSAPDRKQRDELSCH